ncbi:MAG: hypothetical protein J3R72DRAFT_441612, partial [Linnemannia gamsii]
MVLYQSSIKSSISIFFFLVRTFLFHTLCNRPSFSLSRPSLFLSVFVLMSSLTSSLPFIHPCAGKKKKMNPRDATERKKKKRVEKEI